MKKLVSHGNTTHYVTGTFSLFTQDSSDSELHCHCLAGRRNPFMSKRSSGVSIVVSVNMVAFCSDSVNDH